MSRNFVRWKLQPRLAVFSRVEERWSEDWNDWDCRGRFRADVKGSSIAELSVYCTGDWDTEREEEHQRAVKLLRP